MVRDRLRVGRADADVDEGDPGAALAHQVVGRHLEAPPRSVLERRSARRVVRIHDDPAGRCEGVVGALGADLGQRVLAERVHVAVVVREEHVPLELLHGRPAVMREALEGEVHPQAVEDREGPLLAAPVQLAVGQLVADVREVGCGAGSGAPLILV